MDNIEIYSKAIYVQGTWLAYLHIQSSDIFDFLAQINLWSNIPLLGPFYIFKVLNFFRFPADL